MVFGRRDYRELLEDENGISMCIMILTYIINKDDDAGFCPQTTELSRQREGEMDSH